MCACVCVSACLSARISPEPHAWSLPNFYACCLWSWLSPSSAGWVTKSQGGGAVWGVFSIDSALYSIALGRDPYKNKINSWTDRDAVWDDELAWPEEQCVTWGWRSPKGKGQFCGKRVRQAWHPMNCELNWSMQWRAHDRPMGRRLIAQALDKSIIAAAKGGVGSHTADKVWYLPLHSFIDSCFLLHRPICDHCVCRSYRPIEIISCLILSYSFYNSAYPAGRGYRTSDF